MKKQLCCAASLFVSIALSAARLPTNVIPNHYAITITPNLADETFSGEETIDVDVKESVSSIIMNAIGFSYHDVSVTSGGKTVTANVAESAANETITLTTAEPLAVGPASIHIGFDAPLNKQLRGLYISRTPSRANPWC